MAREHGSQNGMMAGMSYLQPHEGITGTERTEDDLLDLSDKALARRDIILRVADNLWAATLVGQPAPKVREMYERMNKPQPGDLVWVPDGAMSRDPDRRAKSFGVLLAERVEWWTTDEQWDAYLAEERQHDPDFSDERRTDQAWYVQYGPQPADVCRWTNCMIKAVLTERGGW